MKARATFLFFFVCTFLCYYPARGGRFVFDFIDWYTVYEQQGWRGFFTDFHDFAFRPGLHLIEYTLHVLLKLSPIGWLVVVSAFHASIATVSMLIIEAILKRGGVSRPLFIAFFSALLFVLSPYQTEVVAWGGAFIYLPAALSYVLALYCFMRYTDGQHRYIYGYYSFFIFAVFCHEIAFTLPLLVTLLILFARNINGSQENKIQLLLKTVLPLFCFVPVYFIVNKLTLGKWIGHYGAAVHLHINPMAMIDKLNMYMVKLYLFAPFWKLKLYQWSHKHAAIYLCIVLLALAVMTLLLKAFRNLTLRYVLIFGLITVILLAMVLNLYLLDFINIHGDRLGYFASIFAFVPVFILLARLPKVAAVAGAIVIAAVSFYFLHINIDSWTQASHIAAGLDKDFKYSNANHLYILNLPDSYKGAYMYRCRAAGKFAQKQIMLTGQTFPAKEVDVLSYNLTDPSDSVSVERISDTTLKVTLSRWGEWFWKDTYGASSYEDSMVRVSIDEWNHGYTVDFKRKAAGDVYLYQCADRWQSVEGF